MDEVKLALEMNKLVHNECKDVPHDIGLRLMEVVKKHVGEQLNLPPVIGRSEQLKADLYKFRDMWCQNIDIATIDEYVDELGF